VKRLDADFKDLGEIFSQDLFRGMCFRASVSWQWAAAQNLLKLKEGDVVPHDAF